jgi:hypothetical protein
MQLAGMLRTNYSYTAGSTVAEVQSWSGNVIPNLGMQGIGLLYSTFSHALYTELSQCQNAIRIGRFTALNPFPHIPFNNYRGGALTATMTLAIDQKVDDGIPNTGMLVAVDGVDDNTPCRTTAGGGTGYWQVGFPKEYRLDSDVSGCLVSYCFNEDSLN